MSNINDIKHDESALSHWKIWRMIDVLSAFFNKISAFMLLLVIVMTWYQVCARAARVSVSGITETGGYLLIWITYLAIADTLKADRHIKVDLMTRKMPPGIRALFSIISNFVCAGFGGVLAWESIKLVQMYYVLNERSLFLNIPVYIVFIALPVGFILFGLEALKNIVFTLPFVTGNQERKSPK